MNLTITNENERIRARLRGRFIFREETDATPAHEIVAAYHLGKGDGWRVAHKQMKKHISALRPAWADGLEFGYEEKSRRVGEERLRLTSDDPELLRQIEVMSRFEPPEDET